MTVEELLEIEEIKRLRTMYSHYLDGGDLDGLVGLCLDHILVINEAHLLRVLREYFRCSSDRIERAERRATGADISLIRRKSTAYIG